MKLPIPPLKLASRDSYEDEGRGEFLEALDASSAPLDKWEKSFVYANCGKKSFTPAQRTQIDRLGIKYAQYY